MIGKSLRRRYLAAMGIPLWELRDCGGTSTRVPGTETIAAPEGATQPFVPGAPVPEAVSDPRSVVAGEVAAPRAPVMFAAPPGNEARGQSMGPDSLGSFDWDTLKTAVSTCTACGLHTSRTQTVFGVGARDADLMVIGEAPGADEDRQGEPFVGRAGRLLNAMLEAAGLRREEVYIANILKCRPPGNRDPRPEETACCEGFLRRQLELVNPRAVLAVGRIAAQNLLATTEPLSRLRGRVQELRGTGIPVVVTYHPAYLLRSPLQKRRAWQDLLLARVTMEGPE